MLQTPPCTHNQFRKLNHGHGPLLRSYAQRQWSASVFRERWIAERSTTMITQLIAPSAAWHKSWTVSAVRSLRFLRWIGSAHKIHPLP